MVKSLLAYLLLLPASYASNAGTMFEGFYRIETDGRHSGYVIQRLYRDPKSSRLILTTYVRTVQNGREVSESMKSESTMGVVAPISSSYSGQVEGKPARVEAKFRKTASLDAVDVYGKGKGVPKETRKVIHPTYLSSMVFYIADLAKFHVDRTYGYLAFSEERGRTSLGSLRLIDDKPVTGFRILHLEDDFLGQRVENFVSETGEPLGARNPAAKAIVRWVPSLEQAAAKMKVPENEIVNLFGNMPKGRANAWSGAHGFDSNSIISGFTKPVHTKRANVIERKSSMASMPVKGL